METRAVEGRISPEEFSALFSTFEQSAFRLETRKTYRVPQEEELIKEYLEGKPLPSDTNEAWCKRVKDAVSAGKTMSRVHVMPTMLTPYLRFEIEWGYLYNAEAGEQILLCQHNDPAQIFGSWPVDDFWLFDNEICVRMQYGADDAFQFGERITKPADLKEHQHLRDIAIKRSITLNAYLSKIRSDARL
jgi:hypothetical protein